MRQFKSIVLHQARFPAEAVMTPRLFSSSLNDIILLYDPRTLNELFSVNFLISCIPDYSISG